MDVLRTYFNPSSRVGGPAALKGKAAQQGAAANAVQLIVPLFVSWKAVLLTAACLSPGLGYDTSTQIFLHGYKASARSATSSWLVSGIEHFVLRLTRWDAIYFASAAERGQVYEQEWAFSGALSTVMSWTSTVLFAPFPLSPNIKTALAGILISNASHLATVLTLYHFIYTLVPASSARKRHLAFTTAALHIISPAGIFLCAPYGESTFALCNFLGMLSYTYAVQAKFSDARYAQVPRHVRTQGLFWTITAGIWFALATTIRSNGILSGMIFAWDALASLPRLSAIFRSRDQLLGLAATFFAGLLVAIGYAGPQVVAYREYCTGDVSTTTRPWCTVLPPSIYTFVQSYYWNVGFLRYWTVSNLPLFALALPLGWIMFESALQVLFFQKQARILRATRRHHATSSTTATTTMTMTTTTTAAAAEKEPQPNPAEEKVFQHILPRCALPQLVLVVLAATSFHVQILNRISSGYQLWYFVLALEICGGDDGSSNERWGARVLGYLNYLPFKTTPEVLVRVMVGYAIMQGGLYAAFLPPA